jgi:hypothetical protein
MSFTKEVEGLSLVSDGARPRSLIKTWRATSLASDVAGAKGFEPSIFSVTGRRVNRATPRAHAVVILNLYFIKSAY